MHLKETLTKTKEVAEACKDCDTILTALAPHLESNEEKEALLNARLAIGEILNTKINTLWQKIGKENASSL